MGTKTLSIAAVLIFYSSSLAQPGSRKSGQPDLRALSASFEALAQRVGPAVVQIHTSEYSAVDRAGVREQRGSGSGVILDASGFVVTNAHVVRGARSLQVLLASSPAEQSRWKSILKPRGKLVPGRVVGIDYETDLAVLKIEEKGLPALELADSDELRQGQLVLAFGSPLGLDNSVSLGVVSSVARQLRQEDPMIYIQTDAPINPGNSGGPLIDADGRVVGINTLIFSQSGGSEGIGFAAPSNIVRNVFDQIRKTGRVRRGQIGVTAQTITPTMAAGLRLSQSWGVILGDVMPGEPADLAGLKVGDIVLSMNDKPMENARQFDVNLYQQAIGELIRLEVQRGSETFTRTVSISEKATDPYRITAMASQQANPVPRLGVLAVDLTGSLEQLIPPLRRPAGVLVAARLADAPENNELRPGDLINSVNGLAVTDLAALNSALQALGAGDAIVVQVQRLGQLMFLAFSLP
jgi:serine protease Do